MFRLFCTVMWLLVLGCRDVHQSVNGALPLVRSPTLIVYDYDTTAWTEVVRLDPSIALDLRYATDSNFVGERMYECPRCFLRPAAARALVRVQDSLRKNGLSLLLYDCYRPLTVQWRLWNKVPDRRYVADPRKGSQHNRGLAVDLTLVDLDTGGPLDMGTAYDYFGGEAWHRATVGFPEPVRGNRELILDLMEGMGWKRTNSEWWHYRWPVRAAVDSMEWACPPPLAAVK